MHLMDGNAGSSEKLKAKAEKVLGIIQTAGIVISVIMLMVIGMKYILSSVEERADYKQTLMPYLIGAVLVFTGTTIPQLIYIIASNIYYLTTGKVVAKDSSIKTDDIAIVSLKYNDELIVSSDDLNSKRLTENIGYNELFTKDKVNNIKDWYFEIEYKVDNETKKDILPVTIRNL